MLKGICLPDCMSSFLMMKRCSFSLPVAATSASNFCRIAGVMAGSASSSCTQHEKADVALAATSSSGDTGRQAWKGEVRCYGRATGRSAEPIAHHSALLCLVPAHMYRQTDRHTDHNEQTDRRIGRPTWRGPGEVASC